MVQHRFKRLKPEILEKDALMKQPLELRLSANLTVLRQLLYNCYDAQIREFRGGPGNSLNMAIIYYGMVQPREIESSLIHPLMHHDDHWDRTRACTDNFLDFTKKNMVSMIKVTEITTFKDILLKAASGDDILLVDGYGTGLSFSSPGWEGRPPGQPDRDVIFRGPREAFVEDLHINITMIRRRLKSPNLKMKSFTLGRVTNTQVLMMYIEGLIHELVTNVREKLSAIDVD